jgi:hypothetical protein
VGRHILDTKSPFGQDDLANLMLLGACRDGDIDGINEALKAGADVNTRLPLWMRCGPKAANEKMVNMENPRTLSLTPLMHASNEGHVEAVKLLLSNGAELGLEDADGMQALHFAAEAASAECCRVLFEAGADPSAMDHFDRGALECLPPFFTSSGLANQEWQTVFEPVKVKVLPTLAAAGIKMDEGDPSCVNPGTVSEGVTQAVGKELFTTTAHAGAQRAVDVATLTHEEQRGQIETGVEVPGQMSVGSASRSENFDCEQDAAVAAEGCSKACMPARSPPVKQKVPPDSAGAVRQ